MKASIQSKLLTPSLTLCLLFVYAGCAMNRQGTKEAFTEPSGFLADYSQLQSQSSAPDLADLFYVNHSVNWDKYKQVYIEPIELWTSATTNSQLNKISANNQRILVDYYYAAISNALHLNYFMVDHAGTNVLVIRAAITDRRKSSPVAGFVSGHHSPPQLAGLGKQKLTGTGIAVGAFVIEVEVLDGESHERLVAEWDTHSGTSELRYNFHRTWGDIQRSFNLWADRLATCIQEEKSGVFNKSDL